MRLALSNGEQSSLRQFIQRELNQAAPYAVSNKLTVRDVELAIAFGLVPRVLDKEPVQDAPSIDRQPRAFHDLKRHPYKATTFRFPVRWQGVERRWSQRVIGWRPGF